jgi:hypothetical protein
VAKRIFLTTIPRTHQRSAPDLQSRRLSSRLSRRSFSRHVRRTDRSPAFLPRLFSGRSRQIALADEQSQAVMVDSFSDALRQERKHLAMIQGWDEEAIGLGQQGTATALHSASGAATPSLERGGSASGDGDQIIAPPGTTP